MTKAVNGNINALLTTRKVLIRTETEGRNLDKMARGNSPTPKFVGIPEYTFSFNHRQCMRKKINNYCHNHNVDPPPPTTIPSKISKAHNLYYRTYLRENPIGPIDDVNKMSVSH